MNLLLKTRLNFTQVKFVYFFRGCFPVFMRMIAGYRQVKTKKGRKETQKCPDNIFLSEHLYLNSSPTDRHQYAKV